MGIKYEATGPDSIPSFIFKAAADQLARILTELYQTSLNTGAVPQDWKDAHVVPLFKKDERHLASNYIPVSLTLITCKIMEHIVHSSVMGHFDRHKILTNAQHGFRMESQLKIGKRLLSRYHPSRLCKGIRQSSTSPPSTQVRILWRQPQNQQMDSLLPREQKTERYT